MSTKTPFRLPAAVQSLYFLATGIWPLVHIQSFLAVTGPKDDIWLVETVGVLVATIGIGLAIAAARGTISTEMAVMAVASALSLGIIEIVYVARGRIGAIYLLDTGVEAGILAIWAACWWKHRRRRAGV